MTDATKTRVTTPRNSMSEYDEIRELLAPLRDAVIYARSQRRPMRIGQDFPRTEARIHLGIGIEYGRDRDNAGFWIDSD